MKTKEEKDDLIQFIREEVDCLDYVTCIGYDEEDVDIITIPSIDEIPDHLKFKNNWLSFVGLTCKSQHDQLAKMFNLPVEFVDTIASINQQPKLIIRKDKIFLSVRMIYQDKNKPYRFLSESICFIITGNTLLSFQTVAEDTFKRVEECLFEDDYHLRHTGLEVLLLEMLKEIFNNYELLLRTLKDQMEQIEEDIINQKIGIDDYVFSMMKKKCNHLWKITTPLEEMLEKLVSATQFFTDERSLRRLNNFKLKLEELIKKVEEYDEDFMTLYQLYMSYKGNNLNHIMKTLTLFSIIFMPLSLLAGIYGMNFKYFPELELKYGYHGLLGSMLIIAGVLLVIFKRKKWF